MSVAVRTSNARAGFDMLLLLYPWFDVLSVDWQSDGPWLLVQLGQPSEGDPDAHAVHHFAIWRHTGAVHGVDWNGAVTDDMLFTPVQVDEEEHP